MAESNDVQILEKISTEVDESQFKIILLSQCIKAQGHLVDKLHKHSENQKQICNFISNGNLKLEKEIKLAEQVVKSILSAFDTIKIANVELKKEILLAKERKLVVNERVSNGIKKYEELWATSKRRYESIPFIQNYLQIKNRNNILRDNIVILNNELHKLRKDITIRKIEHLNLDRKQVIEVAKFMVHVRPKMLKNIQDKFIEIQELSTNIQKLTKENSTSMKNVPIKNTVMYNETNNKNEPMDIVTESSWFKLSKDFENAIMLPKLQIRNVDLDSLTNKLDQMKKIDSQCNFTKNNSENNITIEKIINRSSKSEEMIKDLYVSSYFQTSKNSNEHKAVMDCKSKKYSENKLINILKDIKLDKMETYNIVSKIKPSCLKDIDMIQVEVLNIKRSQEKTSKSVEGMVIQEIDTTKIQSQNIIIPPSQFLDLTQEQGSQSKQELSQKETNIFKNSSQEKRVTFDTMVTVQNMDIVEDKSLPEEINNSPNNQLNVSTISDDSYTKMKEVVFRKHNLDLSPQFTYTKKAPIPMRSDNNVVKSNFFFEKNDDTDKISQIIEIDDNVPVDKPKVQEVKDINSNPKNTKNMDVQENVECQNDKPVAGFLFTTHGPQSIPDSLNISISTTGYDDEDADFPECIDSSVLLSPKAHIEIPSTSNNNVQVLSQEVPNFLTGMRKTAFSFFGNNTSENKLDGNNETENNNFTFSFGGGNKKNRGGLFNMFH